MRKREAQTQVSNYCAYFFFSFAGFTWGITTYSPPLKGIEMFKKTAALVTLVLALVFLTACGQADKTAAPAVNAVPVKIVPFSLNGTWHTDPSDTSSMVAEISDDTITINLVDKKADTTFLYWKGTWTTPTTSTNGTKIVSDADVEALASSLLASQNPNKEFTYSNHELTFVWTMMGMTKNVHLKK
jgi:hypothetical protein